VTFSKAIGYLEKGYNFDGTLAASEKARDYFCIIGQVPILDYFFDKNPIYRIGPPPFGTITNISINHLIDRYQGNDKQYHHPSKPDFLDKFIEAKKLHPDVIDDTQIVSCLMFNMIAGADTMAITIRAVFYHVFKDPRVWNRLEKDNRLEEDVMDAGFADKVPVPFKDAHNIPYLDAVVREAMHMHPAVGMILERYVPESGLRLPDGSFLPAGVTVCMNPYIIARNQDLWGDDAEIFRPEGWLRDEEYDENDEDYQERLRCMNSADLTFGAGSRMCIGKNLALVEVYKVIATLVTLYRIEPAHPDQDWKVINEWFMRQEGLKFRLSQRDL
jgi:cytochrome P450